MQEASRAAPPWWFLVLLPLFALATVFVAFGPALHGRFLDWDDKQAVAQNADLRLEGSAGLAWRFTTTHMGHYQPLTWWSLSLDAAGAPEGELGDEVAARCHRTNLLLHALGAIAFGLLAERLLRASFRGSVTHGAVALAALFASLFWALHPLRVESVAWITERRDVLSAIPLVLSIYLYVLWVEGRRSVFFVASVLLLAISLLCKAWGMVVPALLLVLDFHPLRRAELTWRNVAKLALEKAPFWLLSFVFAGIAWRAQASQPDAMPSFAEHTLAERAVQAVHGLGFYAWKSLVPSGLMPLYEMPKSFALDQARFLVPLIVVPALAVALFLARRRIPGVVAASLAAVILVAPVLGFTQAGPQLAADRYTYLAGLAFALLVAGALLQWSRLARWIPCAVGAGLIVLLAFATHAQAAIWTDTRSLWSYVLDRDPEHVVANLSLGNEFARRAFDEPSSESVASGLRRAEELFQAGLRASNDPRFATRLALVHDALAKLEPARAEEHQRLAMDYSEKAVKLAIATGRVKPEVRLQHGLNLLQLGRKEEALVELEWYATQYPDDARAQKALHEARIR